MSWLQRNIQAHLLNRDNANISHNEQRKILQKTVDLDRSKFQRAISSAHSMLEGADSDFHKSAVYDFIIWSIGRGIAADECSNLMLGKYVQENTDVAYYHFPDIPEARGPKQLIDLAKCNAYTGCWNYARIPTCIASLFKNGYKQPTDSNGVYYPELRLAIMYNGRHHTSWATFLDDCNVMLDTIYLTPYFEIISTDGAFFNFTDELGFTQHIRVYDFRMAVLFQLAKERSALDHPYAVDTYKFRRNE